MLRVISRFRSVSSRIITLPKRAAQANTRRTRYCANALYGLTAHPKARYSLGVSPLESPMEFHTVQLLREPTGSRRTFSVNEPFVDGSAGPVEGEVTLLRTDAGILALADLR